MASLTCRRLALALLLLLALPAGAADADLQTWGLFALQGNLSSRWALYGELQPRLGAELSRVDSLLARGAVGYRLRPKVSLWLGYAWAPRFSEAGGYRDEQRPFEQLLWEEELGAFFIQNRSRFEQRVIAGAGGISLRFRHLARVLVWPVQGSRWAIALSNEVFVTLNDLIAGPPAGFDQNRTFAGLNFRASYEIELELGYLNSLVRQRSPGEAQINHVIALSLWATLF